MDQWKAERALLGRILYKNKNQFGRRFRVYDRLRAVFDFSKNPRDPRLPGAIAKAKLEIVSLLPLGHNLPFLLPSLATISRFHCLSLPSEEDWGEPVS